MVGMDGWMEDRDKGETRQTGKSAVFYIFMGINFHFTGDEQKEHHQPVSECNQDKRKIIRTTPPYSLLSACTINYSTTRRRRPGL